VCAYCAVVADPTEPEARSGEPPTASGRAPRAGAWPDGACLMVLSGGASRRLGRDKATTHLGGRTLLDRLLALVPARVPVVLVGPPVPGLPERVACVREEPPGSGPLAGIGAGLSLVRSAEVGILAADMPFAAPVIARALAELAATAPGRVDAVVPTDPAGHRQPLAGAYRVAPLRAVLAGLEPLAGRPVRTMLEQLRVMEWPMPAADLVDVDTASDLGAARSRVAQEGAGMEKWVAAVREALGLDIEVDLDKILDVARDAAHGVERPAAPVTTFLLGAAVARGADPTEAASTISRLAAEWAGRPQ